MKLFILRVRVYTIILICTSLCPLEWGRVGLPPANKCALSWAWELRLDIHSDRGARPHAGLSALGTQRPVLRCAVLPVLRGGWFLRLFKKIITALLKYNSHTIKFTLVERTVHWFLACSQDWATVTPVYFRTFSSPQKATLYQLVVPFLSPPHPIPWQPLICFLLLWIFPFCTIHVNRIITLCGVLWLASFT